MNKWKDIWNKRHTEGDLSLEKLIKLDGFDSETGKIYPEDWLNYTDFISKKINIKDSDSIYEAGCGSGAFLYPFYEKGHRVGGLDYSENLINIIKKAIPEGDFTCGEAIEIETDITYDILVSNSAFFYFPSYDYAEKVIRKMLCKAKKAVAILDVSDINFKDNIEKAKKDSLGEEEYNKKYEGAGHLYYDRQWFLNLDLYYFSIEIFSQEIKDYGYNDCRFNVIYKKLDI
jgi:trans-aconitate methyltransferase